MLDRVEAYTRELGGLPHRDHVEENIRGLGATIDEHPNSSRWKLRARVGERKRWYEVPEEAHGRGDADEGPVAVDVPAGRSQLLDHRGVGTTDVCDDRD